MSEFPGVALIFYYFLKDGLHDDSERNAVNSLAKFPFFCSTTLFATNAVGVVRMITDKTILNEECISFETGDSRGK